MAGGSGERFWPLSTGDRPKQLLKLTSPGETMLEEAARRIEPVVGEGNVILAIGSTIQAPVLAAGIVPDSCVLAEPAKRNTLGCLCWVAANLLARGDDEATLAVLTADHLIGEPASFRRTVSAAMELAERESAIVTLGIRPTRPETGYGYIEADHSQPVALAQGQAFASKSFREKPNFATAERFLSEGNFLWNSGMFFFRLNVFLAELASANEEAHRLVAEMALAIAGGEKARAEELFQQLPSISVDFAVMEKAKRVFVIPADFPWDDMGSWDAVERSFPADGDGNVSQGRSVLIDTERSVVYNDMNQGVIGVLGLKDVVVVATDDAVLVCAKDQAQRVREIVAALNAAKE
jgi:mannose-1-phosphate guanylyltransferase